MTKRLTPILLATLLVPGAGMTRPAETLPTVRIEYKDLNLGTREGVNALDRRIKRTINALCAVERYPDPGGRAAERRCKQVRRAQATPQRNRLIARDNPTLLAVSGVRD